MDGRSCPTTGGRPASNDRRAVENICRPGNKTEKRRADEHARDVVREKVQRRTRKAASASEATTAVTTRRIDAQVSQLLLQQLEATAKESD